MALSKPVLHLVGTYLQNLYLYPVRTKSITSGTLAATANLCSQLIAGQKSLNGSSILAFGLFGFLFGGSVPHYFYLFLQRALPPSGVRHALLYQLLLERLLYTPLFQLFALYTTSRLEGRSHQQAMTMMLELISPVLLANWKWLTALQVINLTVIPPMLRVLFVNLVGFFWVMYLAKVRRDKANSDRKTSNKSS